MTAGPNASSGCGIEMRSASGQELALPLLGHAASSGCGIEMRSASHRTHRTLPIRGPAAVVESSGIEMRDARQLSSDPHRMRVICEMRNASPERYFTHITNNYRVKMRSANNRTVRIFSCSSWGRELQFQPPGESVHDRCRHPNPWDVGGSGRLELEVLHLLDEPL